MNPTIPSIILLQSDLLKQANVTEKEEGNLIKLSGIFESIDVEVILKILRENNGDLNSSLDNLLSFSTDQQKTAVSTEVSSPLPFVSPSLTGEQCNTSDVIDFSILMNSASSSPKKEETVPKTTVDGQDFTDEQSSHVTTVSTSLV